MNKNVDTKRAAKIAQRNDKYRYMGYEVIVTKGVAYGVHNVCGLLRAIENYDDFNEENDPRGEHDFGALDWHGRKIFWKIDYFKKDYQYYCDPLSWRCRRVLTVMLAEEY